MKVLSQGCTVAARFSTRGIPSCESHNASLLHEACGSGREAALRKSLDSLHCSSASLFESGILSVMQIISDQCHWGDDDARSSSTSHIFPPPSVHFEVSCKGPFNRIPWFCFSFLPICFSAGVPSFLCYSLQIHADSSQHFQVFCFTFIWHQI